jgi:hypothetical protein
MRGPQKGGLSSRGSSNDIGGAANTCPVAVHLVGRWSSDVDAHGRGAVIGCEDSSADGPNDAEDPRNPISPGSKELRASQRLDGRAVVGGLR